MPTKTDIANRALQRCGAARIADGALATEDSRNAAETRAMFDLLLRAELRRNVWRFSIKTTMLYALSETGSRLVTFGTWLVGTTYAAGDIVTASDGAAYISRSASNTGNNPTLGFTFWSIYTGQLSANLHTVAQSYRVGDLVYVASTLYRSVINANTDTPPTANWQTMTTAPTLVTPVLLQPRSRFRYRLPAAYLRVALQDPKNGAVQAYGGPVGYSNNDWVYEDVYVLSSEPGPIGFRFASESPDPNAWDALFCEGFASRLSYELCEPLTQSSGKKSQLAADYSKFMSEARIVNGIEQGPIETPLDPLIEARL